ncbi:cell division protein FtsK [Enterococcus sp. 8G7_MSG3316]|uniref:DNA translocase FtsK n=1 Tax=Candidatus Enterococcus testudinis TaxID=1834191 RepID=A0A242A393_9ENTE|nr:DNA translocase FtsK [Enterococcus sp. 8G7_MSG3316]OTN75389.1 cell division protein FtsK [Enterococcus sp. 8G7_MSG3316]
MAQKKRAKKRKTKKQQKQQEKLLLVGIGLVFILFSIFGFFHLGFLGTLIANGFRIVGGNTYRVLCIALAAYGVWLAIKTTEARFQQVRRIIGCLLIYFGLLIILHAHLFGNVISEQTNVLQTTWTTLLSDIRRSQVSQNVGGGMTGALLYNGSYFLVSQIGSYIVAVLLILVGGFLFSNMHSHELLDHLQAIGDRLQRFLEGSPEKQAEKEARKAEKAAEKQAKKEAERAAVLAEIKEKNQVRPMTEGERLAKQEQAQTAETFEPEQLSFVPIDHFQEIPASAVTTAEAPHPAASAAKPSKRVNEDGEILDDDGEVLEFEISEEAENRDYELPSAELLDSIPATDQSSEYKKIEKNIGVLETTFQSFGVDAKVVKASLGPAVTKFEVQPAVGVKVSKIVGLTDDIALALAAKDVRMEAPIPGKSLIGIEVPNSAISMVSFREVIDAQPDHPDQLLEVPLGRDISGRVQTADLTKMPHLLIAGSTGSGKSVAINGIITSILMRAKPHEVKLMMIDPKMVELNVYNGIPHLLTPVVTNPRKAAQALQKVVKEMEERYEKFAATGVRNITGYNELVINKNLEDGENRPILPFIVVIVDELADLMMVASNEVEDAIIRLAQMARAAGIHMILATQRPSVDVITGIIKANVPSRMAFAVSSGVDSRTIIDSNGAEKLLGRGDMLYLPMGENKPIRVQGAFISDHEVERIVSFVTDQQEANYEEKMMVTEEETTSSSSGQPQDELFEEAKALVIDMQTASVSLLQRRFRVGYNRAARLVDELEAQGVVGPSEGSKPRKVLIEPQAEEIPPFEE